MCKGKGYIIPFVERDNLLWRRKYLETVRQYRAEGRQISYLDGTWVNTDEYKPKVWKDTTDVFRRDAFVKGLTTGHKKPSVKEKRLIVVHIGSSNSFVPVSLLCFESKKVSINS